MDLGLRGKVALVAAGSKGIGLATATLFAQEGVLVSLCGRHLETLESARRSSGAAHIAVADVTQAAELESWVASAEAQLGPVDILVTNTGGPPAGIWPDMTDEQWQSGFESTLLNIVRMVRLVSEGMKTRGWGRIVHITSLVAKEPNAILPISSTLRAGIMSLTKLQATELAPFGVTVNGVLPGHTLTDRQVHLAEIRAGREGIDLEEALRRQAAQVPMNRLADPVEIAAPIAFLCSQQASFITGTSLLVDGGAVRTVG